MTTPMRGMPPPIDDELLSAYLDGQTTPAEREVVANAAAANPAVRQRLADMEATVTLLRALPQPAPRRTFILTPEQAATIRPTRVLWLTRLFPTVAAVSAVAAVLCLALIAGDLATGGFSMQKQITASRAAVESIAADATSVTTAAQPALPRVAATAQAPAPAPAATTAAASVARAPTAALPPETAVTAAGSFAAASAASPTAAPPAPTVAPTVAPTAVANVQPAPPVSSAPPSGGATVATTETHRVPVALVRAGEIALAVVVIAGMILAAFGWRAKRRRTGNL